MQIHTYSYNDDRSSFSANLALETEQLFKIVSRKVSFLLSDCNRDERTMALNIGSLQGIECP